MALQLAVLRVGAAITADAAVPAVRAASAWPAAAWGSPMATDGPVPDLRAMSSCGPLRESAMRRRNAGRRAPRGVTGATIASSASLAGRAVPRGSSGADRETARPRVPSSPKVVS